MAASHDRESLAWFRIVFMVRRNLSIPVDVFKDVIRKPASACGVNGTLAKVKGRNQWCIVTEAPEEAAMRFADYLTTGEAAFGKTTMRARSMGKQRIEGFHLLEKELDIGRSEEEDEEDGQEEAVQDQLEPDAAPVKSVPGRNTGQPINKGAASGSSEVYTGWPKQGSSITRRRSSSSWRSSLKKERKRASSKTPSSNGATKTVRKRVVHSAAKKSADGWISCAPVKKSSGGSSGNPASTSSASSSAKKKLSERFAWDSESDDSPTLFARTVVGVAATAGQTERDSETRHNNIG